LAIERHCYVVIQSRSANERCHIFWVGYPSFSPFVKSFLDLFLFVPAPGRSLFPVRRKSDGRRRGAVVQAPKRKAHAIGWRCRKSRTRRTNSSRASSSPKLWQRMSRKWVSLSRPIGAAGQPAGKKTPCPSLPRRRRRRAQVDAQALRVCSVGRVRVTAGLPNRCRRSKASGPDRFLGRCRPAADRFRLQTREE
jgi:hypothetical protein